MSKAKTPLKSCSSSNTPERKAVYDGILIQESHQEYLALLEMIQFRENMHAVNFEPLTNKEECSEEGKAGTIKISYRLYSGRDSIKNRLFCLVAKLKKELKTGEITKKKLLITLEMTEHDYDLSYKNKPAVLKARVLKILPELLACMDNQGNLAYEKPGTDRAYMLLNFNQKPEPLILEKTGVKALPVTAKKCVILSLEQETSMRTSLPAIVSGNAGTGKTCVALAMHMEDILKNLEAKKKRLFVANTGFMKKEVKQIWEKMWAEFREKLDSEALKNIPPNAEENLCILTWKDLIAEYSSKKEGIDRETMRGKIVFAHREDLQRWYESEAGPPKSVNYRNYKTVHGSLPEFETLRQDLDKIRDALLFLSGYTETEFLALQGERECPYSGETYRKFLYQEILESYKNFCKKENIVDERFFVMESAHLDYALITVDESQNRSLRQLQSLFYCSSNASIAYFLDPKQQVQANYHLFQRLKKWLGDIQPRAVSSCRLNTCFRSTTQVITMMNRALQIRNQVCDSGKNEASRVIAAKDAREGQVCSVFAPDKKQQELLQKKARNPASVVLVMHKEELESAKKFYGSDAAIFTLSQAIGVEFGTVIIHNPFTHADFSQLNETFRKLREGIPFEKGEAHVNLLPGFLYTLISRAESDVIWVLPGKPRNRQYLIDSYGLENLPEIQDSEMDDSLKAREKQILKFLIMGEWETALQFFLKFGLGKDKEDFKNFCRNKGMETWDFPGESFKAQDTEAPRSAEDFSIANMKKWLNEKPGLFNPAAPEKSRFATILQDEKKIEDFLTLCKGKQIEILDPKEFARCYLYVTDKDFLGNSLPGRTLVKAFIKNHPRGIATLFEELPSHASPKPSAEARKKVRKKNAPIQNTQETRNLFSWLIQDIYFLEKLFLLHVNRKSLWVSYTGKKGFLEKNLWLLSTSYISHAFLLNISNELKKNNNNPVFSEITGFISSETFSKSLPNLLYSFMGWKILSRMISHKNELFAKVIKEETDSGKQMRSGARYSLKNLINTTRPGRKIWKALNIRGMPLAEKRDQNLDYEATCHYIQDLINFADGAKYKKWSLFVIYGFGFNTDQTAFEFLLSKPEGHPYLLSILEKERDMIKHMEATILKKDNLYRQTLFLSECWEQFRQLLTENNEALKQAIEVYLNGEELVVAPVPTPMFIMHDIKESLLCIENSLSENRIKYIRNILHDFSIANVHNLLNSSVELLNTLLFTRISLDTSTEKTCFLAEILKDSNKYLIFKSKLFNFLYKINPVRLAHFLIILDFSSTDSANFSDFFRFILEKMASPKRNSMMTAYLFARSTDSFLAEIVKDRMKYAIYLQTMSNPAMLPTLDLFQLKVLFIEHANFNHIPTQNFLKLLLQSYPLNDELLCTSLTHHYSSGVVQLPSLLDCICNDAEKSVVFLNLLMDLEESISSWLFYNNDGIEFIETQRENHSNKEIPRPFFKKLLASEAGCNRLIFLFNTLSFEYMNKPHPWLFYISNIFGNFSQENALILRNLCASPRGQYLLRMMLHRLTPLSVNASLFYTPGLNYKNEMLSPFQALHRSAYGIHCIHAISKLLTPRATQTENPVEQEIGNKGYAAAHIGYLKTPRQLLEERQLIAPKPAENFQAMVSLCIDWLSFADEERTSNPLKQEIEYKQHKSMADILFSRRESMALLYLELQKKPKLAKHFRMEDLRPDSISPCSPSNTIFHDNLTQTVLGRKLLDFLYTHNPKLKEEWNDFLKNACIQKTIMDPCPEKLQHECDNLLSSTQGFGEPQILKRVVEFLEKTPECQKTFGMLDKYKRFYDTDALRQQNLFFPPEPERNVKNQASMEGDAPEKIQPTSPPVLI